MRTATIVVNVFADRVAEFDEQFRVTVGDSLSSVSATGTIVNDDAGIARVSASVAQPIAPQAFAWAAAGMSAAPETTAPGTKKTVKTLP